MIRKATFSDLDEILKIYSCAREFMKNTGNPTQWKNGYPSREILEEDIEKSRLYLCEEENILLGVFVFFLGGDPTYSYIEGAWKDESPYGTIHRIASSGAKKGFFTKAMQFCKTNINHIRIDTHKDNKVMQETLKKHGFSECGIIYLENGEPRLAFEYVD